MIHLAYRSRSPAPPLMLAALSSDDKNSIGDSGGDKIDSITSSERRRDMFTINSADLVRNAQVGSG